MIQRLLVLIVAMMTVSATLFAAEPRTPSTVSADQSVVRILRTPNKAQINEFVCETLEFQHVNPFNVINFLWGVVSREEGGIYSFKHPTEDRGKVLVICPEYQLPQLRQLAKELDRPGLNSAPGSRYIYYRMSHRNASDPGFLNAASHYLAGSGVLIPDIETNSLQIFDAPVGADDMKAALDDILDKPLTQYEMRIKVYEVNVNSDGTMGLDYQAWKNGPGQSLGIFLAEGGASNLKTARHFHYNTRSSGMYLDYPAAYFDFLVQKGKATSIINTKAAGSSGWPAVAIASEQILWYRVENDAPLDRTVTATIDEPVYVGQDQNIWAADAGVELIVLPTVGTESINMDIMLGVINCSGYDGMGQPLLNSRMFEDSIVVADGEEVIFGGLTRERSVKVTRKVPILGSIPVLGYVFGGDIVDQEKAMVVASVQPTIIVDNDNITEKDREIVERASGEQVVRIPVMSTCFDETQNYTW